MHEGSSWEWAHPGLPPAANVCHGDRSHITGLSCGLHLAGKLVNRKTAVDQHPMFASLHPSNASSKLRVDRRRGMTPRDQSPPHATNSAGRLFGAGPAARYG
jgi:hypothetical protein